MGTLREESSEGCKKFKEAGPRYRYLSGDELSRFLVALDVEAEKLTANALKLLLLTGVRKMELFSLRWSEVDLPSAFIRLLHTKNGRSRVVVLNSLALELMKKIHAEAEAGCPYVFPARTGDGHLIDIRKPIVDFRFI